jgi:hypothetical protein
MAQKCPREVSFPILIITQLPKKYNVQMTGVFPGFFRYAYLRRFSLRRCSIVTFSFKHFIFQSTFAQYFATGVPLNSRTGRAPVLFV